MNPPTVKVLSKGRREAPPIHSCIAVQTLFKREEACLSQADRTYSLEEL
jgi:hypothetical protein